MYSSTRFIAAVQNQNKFHHRRSASASLHNEPRCRPRQCLSFIKNFRDEVIAIAKCAFGERNGVSTKEAFPNWSLGTRRPKAPGAGTVQDTSRIADRFEPAPAFGLRQSSAAFCAGITQPGDLKVGPG